MEKTRNEERMNELNQENNCEVIQIYGYLEL